MKIQFSGIKLEQEKQDLINSLVDRLISRGFEIEILNIEVKESRKAGGRSLYTTHLRAEIQPAILSSEATEWGLEKSLRGAFGKIEKEIRR